MIEILKFIEQLELLHKMLTVESKDDDPAKIITRGKIRELLKKYQHEVDEFEKWAEAESQKDAYLGGYSEEHIKQMTDEKHNQWGVAGEPKKTRVQ